MLQLDPVLREAKWQGRSLTLGGSAFELLVLLAASRGEPLSSTRLLRALWPGRRVDPANLRMQVAALRRHLGAEALRNVRGRGYLLTVPVMTRDAVASPAAGLMPGPLAGPLPVQVDDPIGREACLQQLAAVLQQHRLACVLGPGGIGKTRVALRLAHHLRTQALPGGVVWVDLVPLPATDAAPSRLCEGVAEAAGLQWSTCEDDQAPRRLGQAIDRATGGAASLLVLDNAEHVVAPLASVLPGLLASAPALRVLVTSQHAFPLPFGQAMWLPPLDTPSPDAGEDDIRASAAVQLLLRRAQALHPHWSPSVDDWPALGALVRSLGGLALALELAAPRLPLMGAEALHERLADRVEALGVDGHAERPRHETLRAALDWSFALLPHAEQSALGQLSVFAAPFRLESAVRALRIDGLDDIGLEHVIRGLVDHSMLQLLAGGAHNAAVRLRLAETTRAYAAQRLQAAVPGAVRACEQRHGQAMAALARRASEDFLGASDVAWSARWLPDLEDMQRAFDHAAERGDAEVAADLIEALVLSANITGRSDPALKRWHATRALAGHAAPLARAKLLGWGNLAQSTGTTRLEQSAQRLQTWRAVPGEQGRRGLCVALAMHAVSCQDGGDPDAATAACTECLELESPEWPVRLRRRCSWIALTRLAIARGDDVLLARAGSLSSRIAAELQQQGAWRELTLVQGQQALMLRLRGDARGAAELLAQAARTQLQLGCGLDAGRSLAFQCAALIEEGARCPADRPDLADAAWRAARQVAARALPLLEPYPIQILHVAEALAELAASDDEPELAVHLLSGAEQLRQNQQLGRDRLIEQAACRAWLKVQGVADADTLQRCLRHGRQLSAESLRGLALRWLARSGIEAPAASEAS